MLPAMQPSGPEGFAGMAAMRQAREAELSQAMQRRMSELQQLPPGLPNVRGHTLSLLPLRQRDILSRVGQLRPPGACAHGRPNQNSPHHMRMSALVPGCCDTSASCSQLPPGQPNVR